MIYISSAATQEVLRLRRKQSHDGAFLRLGIQAGGCCQWSYTLGFADTLQSDDTVYPCDQIQVLIDSQSLRYLENLNIDYSEDLMGGGFRFQNPQATQTCSCGHSFFAG